MILAIHGGGFISGDKADGQITPVLEALSRGYAVAGVNYRLSGEATFPAAISDVKAAIRWLRAHAGEYQLDPSRFAAWGHSAGGNLAALAGTSGDLPALRGPHPANAGQSDRLQAVVDWYGPISFLRTDRDFRAAGFKRPSAAGPRSFLSQYLGAPLAEVPGKVKAADPITYITARRPAGADRARHRRRHRAVPAVQALRPSRVREGGAEQSDPPDLPRGRPRGPGLLLTGARRQRARLARPAAESSDGAPAHRAGAPRLQAAGSETGQRTPDSLAVVSIETLVSATANGKLILSEVSPMSWYAARISRV